MAGNRRRLILALAVSITLHGWWLTRAPDGLGPSGVEVPGKFMLDARLVAARSPAIAVAEVVEEMPADLAPAVQPVTPGGGVMPSAPVTPSVSETKEPYHFSARELHQRPLPLRRIDTDSLARRFPGQTAVLTFWIDETGHVEKVEIKTASPDFEQGIIDFIEGLSFVPGKIASRAVKSRVDVEIALPDTDAGSH